MLKMRLFLSAFAVLFMFIPFAMAGGWIAGDVKHPARYTLDSKTWIEIKPGMSLPKASWIHVGKRGHLSLIRGKETIEYKANTLAALIQHRGDVKTEIRQQIGSVTLDVQKRNRKHMTVQTPFLAAVVKGTKFVVNVGKKKAELRVIRGVVEVTDPVRGERVDVAKGQGVSVAVNASKTMRIQGVGKKFPVVKVKKSKPVIAPAPSKASRNKLARKSKDKIKGKAKSKSSSKSESKSSGKSGGKSSGKSESKSSGKSGGKSSGKSESKSSGKSGGKSSGKGKK